MNIPLRASLSLALAATMLAGSVGTASAAPPTVRSVSPLSAKVGQNLTVRGSDFLSGSNRNTVIFMSDYGPTIFVKAPRASSTSMVVPLPARLEQGMRKNPNGSRRANRFQLRVVARAPARSFTPRAKSPVIAPLSSTPPPPPDSDRDGTPDSSDPDDDNDFLADADETAHGTNTRLKDTDGDGLEDGWEYYAAKDLNIKAVPYPGDRPFPNALDPSDANVDFDGDFLRSGEEHALWRYTGRAFEEARLSNGQEDSPLGYSDGTQTSRREQAPTAPAFQRFAGRPDLDPGYDPRWAEPTYPAFLSRERDPSDSIWSDDERDADRDGLSNMSEEHHEMSKSTWNALLAKCNPPVIEWEDNENGSYYGAFNVRGFGEPKMLDPDTDGDQLLDAEDDQDNDDVPNYSEMDFRCGDDLLIDADDDGEVDDPNPSGTPNVHPYNPCAPHGGRHMPVPGFPMARTCPYYKPLDG